MRNLNFNHPGGFPLTQDVLDYMQLAYNDHLISLLSYFGIPKVGKFVITGIETAPNYDFTAGWVAIDGQIFEVIAGNGEYLEMVVVDTIKTYEDLSDHIIHSHSYFIGSPNTQTSYFIPDFIRKNLSTSKELNLTNTTTGILKLSRTYNILHLEGIINSASEQLITTLPLDDSPTRTMYVQQFNSGSQTYDTLRIDADGRIDLVGPPSLFPVNINSVSWIS